jgi:hypothetical protein
MLDVTGKTSKNYYLRGGEKSLPHDGPVWAHSLRTRMNARLSMK